MVGVDFVEGLVADLGAGRCVFQFRAPNCHAGLTVSLTRSAGSVRIRTRPAASTHCPHSDGLLIKDLYCFSRGPARAVSPGEVQT